MERPAWRTHRLVVAERNVLQCAITDLCGQGIDYKLDRPAARKARLRAQVHGWAVDGVDIVQLREKQLESGEFFDLACAAMDAIRSAPPTATRTRLLINVPAHVAAAPGADGVHLASHPGELSPMEVREVFRVAGRPQCLVSVSCHQPVEVAAARKAGADLILFGPVFEKRVRGELVSSGVGVDLLREACVLSGTLPVLALGGVSSGSVRACLEAGAAGIAAIRFFG